MCAIEVDRHRHRHLQGASGQDLRSLLHHQAGGPGHGPGPCHRLWHRQAVGRLHHRGQRSRARAPASRSICRAIASMPSAPVVEAPRRRRRATSPARTRSCWSRTRKRCAASRRGRCACAAIMCWKPAAARKRWRSSRRATQEIDLLITDVVMPNMDGPTMVRHVKGLKPDLPVIFMSGYAEEAFRRNDEKPRTCISCPSPSASSSWPPRSRKCCRARSPH